MNSILLYCSVCGKDRKFYELKIICGNLHACKSVWDNVTLIGCQECKSVFLQEMSENPEKTRQATSVPFKVK